MKKIIYLFFLNFLFVLNGHSQSVLGTCGTTGYDNYLIKQRMLENREEWKNKILPRGGAITYIPINFWLTAASDGSGRIPLKNIIDNLCCMNKIYSDFGMAFYIKGIMNVDPKYSNYIYDDPSSQLGELYINSIMVSNRSALNVFVTNVANASELGVLAFYRPLSNSNGDYIVCNKAKLNGNCQTLAHEIGHFFSLAHTFYGWENTVYTTITTNCTKPTPTIVNLSDGTPVLVEYVDRNKQGSVPNKKNCQEAADGFCDTPADYNLGFGWSGCTYTGCAKDPDGLPLNPSEINLMSYFLDCIKEFTQEQKDAIIKDMLSAKRNFLRKVNYTPKADVVDQPNYITPTAASPAQGYDTIRFDWDDVPNAEFYLFDIAENNAFSINPKSFILTHSDTVLTNFIKNHNYFWRVTPYNTNSFCVEPKNVNFKTPNWTVASENIENQGLSSYVLQTSESNSVFIINSDKIQRITIQLLNSNGQILNTQTEQLSTGENRIPLIDLNSGFYFYRLISNDRKQNTGKFFKI